MSLTHSQIEDITAVVRGLIARMKAVKSYEWYDEHMHQYARQFYNDKITDSELLDKLMYAIGEQLKRAWNEGMVENGLDPDQDKTPEMEARIDELINNEYDHVTDLIDFINTQKEDKAGMVAIDSRIDLWVNRYNDVVNIAIKETSKAEDLLEWIYGDTEHCDTCAALNGIVATKDEWDARDLHPQQPPNDMLECGGWRCQCQLLPTDKKPTEGGIPDV